MLHNPCYRKTFCFLCGRLRTFTYFTSISCFVPSRRTLYWFSPVLAQMLIRFHRSQVATACYSCRLPNLSSSYLIHTSYTITHFCINQWMKIPRLLLQYHLSAQIWVIWSFSQRLCIISTVFIFDTNHQIYNIDIHELLKILYFINKSLCFERFHFIVSPKVKLWLSRVPRKFRFGHECSKILRVWRPLVRIIDSRR
jgi:hypothetical protein